MFLDIVICWFILGVLMIVLTAYDPFSRRFEWDLGADWEFFWFQRPLTYAFIIVFMPYSLPKEIYTKISERKYVKEWRNNGSFWRKLK